MPLKTDIYVGARVREARIVNRLTQTQLADRLGISFQQVQKYEKGTNRIGASRLLEISEALVVSVPFFFEGLSNDQSSEAKVSRSALLMAKELLELKDEDTRENFLYLIRLFYK